MTRRFFTSPAGLRRLWADRRGAIAPMAAFILIPLLLGAGMALDISRLISSRTQVQDAVDSANLALARMPASSTTAQLKAVAQAWIDANVTDSNIINLQVQDPVRTLGQIQLTVTGDVKTVLSQNLGVPTLPLVGKSTVKYGTSHVELALVLDNTGSMASAGKLTALKTAAGNLVDTLSSSADVSGDPNALKISVVPFSMAVNIGAGNQGAVWLAGSMPAEYGATADALGSSHPNRFTLLSQIHQTWKGCVESRPMPYDISDAEPNPAIPASLFVPFFAPDEPDDGYVFKGATKNPDHIYGQYTSGQKYSENNYLADGIPATDNWNVSAKGGGGVWLTHQEATAKYTGYANNNTSVVWGDQEGPNSGCNVASLQRLTNDMAKVKTKLNSMIATGDTEIPLGLVWGWHTLSHGAPFNDGADYGTPGVLKIVVLVTDGENTYGSANNPNGSHYTAYGYAAGKRIDPAGTQTGTESALNSRLALLCSAMKAKNPDGSDKVIIYTVPIAVTTPTVKSLLQTCATKPDYYIDVPDAASLNAAFANIAGSISGLRLAH